MVDDRAVAGATRTAAARLTAAGFEPEGSDHPYRFHRGAEQVDVLAPDHLGRWADLTTVPPGKTAAIPGGTRALATRRVLEVRVIAGPAGPLPVPSLTGGIVLKLRAWESRQAERDAEDLVRLLSLVGDVEVTRAELKPAERRLLGQVRPLADERSRIWRTAADPDDARAAFLRLAGIIRRGRCGASLQSLVDIEGVAAQSVLSLHSQVGIQGSAGGRVPSTVERTWEADPGAVGGRRARASFRYQAFVPDEIAALNPAVPFEVADLSADAEAAIRALNDRASVGGLEAIGPLLLRSEAVASSRIEGYDVSSLNLARALIDPRAARGSARIVAANVSAMEEAIAIGDRTAPVTVADLLAIHAVLMAGDERARPGRVREEQNWIGGRLGDPSDAAFVPPPEGLVVPLLEDLVAFIARNDLPAVAQAAIAHAQFETIHPFIDGNGRVGRALVHVVLRRRGVADRFVPPVSIVLAARPAAYVEGLVAFREGRVADWIGSFATATARAALVSIELAGQVAELQGEWRERAGRPRAGSAASKLIALLPALPVLSAPTARAAIGVSQQQTLAALKTLAEAGVIRQLSAGTYDRQYAATALFDLLTASEEGTVGPARSARPTP